MAKASDKGDPADQREHSPHQVRLPGFISEDEIGLGDVIGRATSYLGIRALRRLPTPSSYAQPLDGLHESIVKVGRSLVSWRVKTVV